MIHWAYDCEPMKTSPKNRFLLPALAAGFVLILAGPATAQTFTTLHSFTQISTSSYGVYTNSDGAEPYAGLILSGNTLYGTARTGGTSGNGTVFAVNTDGTGFTTLYSFTALNNNTNSDGAQPFEGLILSGNTLYGTAGDGGSSGYGTVFALNTDGTGFTTLHSFTTASGSWPTTTNSDGAGPGGLILSGSTLYGTAVFGGSSGYGTVFALNTDGTGFTTLYSLTGGSQGEGPFGLILSGNTLYGTADGGSAGNGMVFAVNTDGTGFTALHSFTGGSDGVDPNVMILSGDTLYGTASLGGRSGEGTVFALNTNGTGFMTLHSFTAGTGTAGGGLGSNSDGLRPSAGLILSGNTLYGTAEGGGTGGSGTVFALNTDGTGFKTLYSFTALDAATGTTNSDGAGPRGLILSGNTLYGTTAGGGSSVQGTVFSVTLPGPPQLTIMPSGPYVILTWPTNAAGFTLQSTRNLLSPAAWTTNSPAPVVVNGQNTVTNPISGAQQFYRLSQ